MNWKKYQLKSWTTLIIILKIYLLIISIFSALRLFFYFYNQDKKLYFTDIHKLLTSFLWGLRFDLIPVTYILAIVYLLLLFYDYSRKKFFKKTAFWLAYILLSMAIFVYAADIIYYNEFAVHLSSQVLSWFNDFSTIVKMIFTAPELSFMFIPFFVILWAWYYLLKKIFYKKYYSDYISSFKLHFSYLGFIILMIFASKGRIIGHTLAVQDAYNDDKLFYNDFKVNPLFSISESFDSKNNRHELNLLPDEEAVKKIQLLFQIAQPIYDSPIARDCLNDSLPVLEDKKNVVFIFMERKATWKMKYFGNRDTMTTFLDSLFLQSKSYDRFYSSGTRTFEGIFGSLYAHPVLFDEHPMKNEVMRKYYGIPQILQENNYETVFFCPHTPRFDNLGVFIPKNGFNRFYYEDNYPKDSLKTNWGVDDHFLFNFALQKMDSLSRLSKPFFSVILTISDHNPYYVPDFIQGKNIKIRAARFADWALKDFFKKVKKKPWFNNTLFVLVGDHGKPNNPIYPVSLSTHHVPLIFYHKGIHPQIIHDIGDQKDILPLLMKELKMNYINNTMGKIPDSLSKSYAYFNHYEKNGILNEKHLLVIDKKGDILGLYNYADKNPSNVKDDFPEIADSLAYLLKAHLQTSYYIRKNNLQKRPEKSR